MTMIFKIALCLVAFVAIVGAKQKKEYLHLPQEVMPLLGEKSLECISKTGIEQEWLPKLLAGQIEDRPEIRKFVYCFATGTDYAEKDGHFKVGKMVKLVGNHKSKETYQHVIEECNQIKGKDDEDTMFQTVECFLGKTPIAFTL